MKKQTFLIIAIAILAIGALAYLGRHKIKGVFMQSAQQPPITRTMQKPALSPTQQSHAIKASPIMTKTSPGNGSFLTDPKGMSLYVFDKDAKGVSNCYGACAALWPPYTATSSSMSNLPANISIIKRTDGAMQYVYKEMPLYYYQKDQKPGDVLGEGIGGIWHLVKP